MGVRRNLKILIAAAFAALLISIRPAFAADNACKGLFTAKPNELLAIFGAREDLSWPSSEWLPPGVGCTWEGLYSTPDECEWTTTITQDRMLGNDRRLIFASSSSPNVGSTDQIFVFGCVAGQRIEVFHDRFQPGAKVVNAAPGSVTVLGFKQPQLGPALIKPRNKPDLAPEDGRHVLDLNDYFQGLDSDETKPGVPLRCSELRTPDANRLFAMEDEGWHVPGCADSPMVMARSSHSGDPNYDREYCESKSKFSKDQMLGAERRLVVVSLEDREGKVGGHYMWVFGCVSGQLRVVYWEYFDGEPHIEDASADELVLLLDAWHRSDGQHKASREKLVTLSWNVGLETYILKGVRFRPARRQESPPLGWAPKGVNVGVRAFGVPMPAPPP